MALTLPNADHFRINNLHIPLCVLGEGDCQGMEPTTREGLVLAQVEIHQGKFARIRPMHGLEQDNTGILTLDGEKRILLPRFVDMHTHLDKGHVWERSPNVDGTFASAVAAVQQDAQNYYSPEDLYRRMEFGIQCSYAHGTLALRTHIDAPGDQGKVSFEVFDQLRREWADRMILQGACLVTTDYYLTPAGERLADAMASLGGILGGVAYVHPDLTAQLTRLLALAEERQLDVDLHVDENGDRRSQVLHEVATLALEKQFSRRIVCGHCCSLGVQDTATVTATLDRVRRANLGIVSLPLCNLYLQGRDHHPAWRGIPPLRTIKAHGIPVALASDNCRDPFYGFGDHDGLEVLTQGIRIGQLEHPYGDWCASVNKIPAQLMGLAPLGEIASSQPAHGLIFQARYFSELFARPQGDRQILDQGREIRPPLPAYSDLDDLL